MGASQAYWLCLLVVFTLLDLTSPYKHHRACPNLPDGFGLGRNLRPSWRRPLPTLTVNSLATQSSAFGIESPSNLQDDWVEVIIPANFPIQRLDLHLTSLYPQYSRSYLSSLCENSLVYINGKPQDKKFRAKPNDRIRIKFLEKQVSTVEPEHIPLEIVYEDDDIIVVNKPVGMVVHPAPGSPNGTFVNALMHHLGPNASRLLDSDGSISSSTVNILQAGKTDDYDDDDDYEYDLPETPDASKATPKSLRPGIVHRLDKGTSGILIAGKHSDAVSKLSKMFSVREVRKVYLVVCVGHPGIDTTIVDYIGRNPKNRQTMVAMDGPPGKSAISHVKTIAFDGKLSAALVRIETGRTHQIRVHLQARRTPVLGDEGYGNKDWNKKLQRMFSSVSPNLFRNSRIPEIRPLLHAYETEIKHPYSGKALVFRAPIPDDMKFILDKLNDGIIPRDNISNDPTNDKLLDDDGYLIGSTEVQGMTFDRTQKSGFVPLDRVLPDEEDWTNIVLPDDS